jgi:CheY-like chemotaxis protein
MKTILLVDDEDALVEILTQLLQDEGYRVVSAANGKDALARLTEEKPDLLITDFMMPIANGRVLIRAMRAIPEFAATPAIMMSATQRAVALTDTEGTVDAAVFLRKPFDLHRLLEAIAELIGQGR